MLRAGGILRINEPHGEQIYGCAFNHVDKTQASVFATVGGREINIYRIEPPPGAEDAGEECGSRTVGPAEKGECGSQAGADSDDASGGGSSSAATASGPAHNGGRAQPRRPKKRSRGAVGAVVGRLAALQTYRDDDTDERFYACDWGTPLHPTPAPLLPPGAPTHPSPTPAQAGTPRRSTRSSRWVASVGRLRSSTATARRSSACCRATARPSTTSNSSPTAAGYVSPLFIYIYRYFYVSIYMYIYRYVYLYLSSYVSTYLSIYIYMHKNR